MPLKRSMISVIIIVSAMLLGVSSGKANLITNGGFEDGTGLPESNYVTLTAGTQSSDDITGWTVVKSNDWVHASYWTPAEGKMSIDLSGDGIGALTSIAFTTTPGVNYEVVFYLSGNFEGGDIFKRLQVSADNQSADFVFNWFPNWSTKNMGWQKKTWIFTADGNLANLTLTSGANNAFGPALDNVSVNVVPLPSALLLLGAGLLRLAQYRQRKSSSKS